MNRDDLKWHREQRQALRLARRNAGLSLDQVASALSWPLIKVLKSEQSSQPALMAGDVKMLFDLYATELPTDAGPS